MTHKHHAHSDAHHSQSTSSSKEHFHEHFHSSVEYADLLEADERLEWQQPDTIVQALNLQPGQTIVEIGAGTGYFVRRIANAYPESTVIACDVEPQMLERIQHDAQQQQLSNIQTVVVNSDEFPTFGESIDYMLCINTYHHIPERSVYFGDLRQQLTPDGRVTIIDFTKDAPHGPPKEHRISREQVIAEFEKAGYQLSAEETFLPYQYFLTFSAIS